MDRLLSITEMLTEHEAGLRAEATGSRPPTVN